MAATDDETVRTMAKIYSEVFAGVRFDMRWVRAPEDKWQLLEAMELTWQGEIDLEDAKDLGSLLIEHVTIEDTLEECHALAFHMIKDEEDRFVRTKWGELEYRAKSDRNRAARVAIGDEMIKFIRQHPRYDRAETVCAIPGHTTKTTTTLPSRLAGQIADALGKRSHVIQRVRTCEQQKEIDAEDKASALERRLANQSDSMACSALPAPGSVILIDDMYGSGASLAEAARSLRAVGATEVLGLAATKQLRFAKYR